MWRPLVLGGMTKNVYHGTFQNFSVYITVFFFFMHNQVLPKEVTGMEITTVSLIRPYTAT